MLTYGTNGLYPYLYSFRAGPSRVAATYSGVRFYADATAAHAGITEMLEDQYPNYRGLNIMRMSEAEFTAYQNK